MVKNIIYHSNFYMRIYSLLDILKSNDLLYLSNGDNNLMTLVHEDKTYYCVSYYIQGIIKQYKLLH